MAANRAGPEAYRRSGPMPTSSPARGPSNGSAVRSTIEAFGPAATTVARSPAARRARTAELARLLEQVSVTVPNVQVKGTSEAC